jgi:hypothetical protein
MIKKTPKIEKRKKTSSELKKILGIEKGGLLETKS